MIHLHQRSFWQRTSSSKFGFPRGYVLPIFTDSLPDVILKSLLKRHKENFSSFWPPLSSCLFEVCVVSRALIGIETLLPWKEECCSAFCRGIILLYALLSSGLLPLSLLLLFFFLRIFDRFLLLSRAAIAQYDNVILLLIFTANSL